MNQSASCPKLEKCPIFTGAAFDGHQMSDNLQQMYIRNYCMGGETKYGKCKRYIAANSLGVPIPKLIMPNSTRSIEEIKLLIEKGN